MLISILFIILSLLLTLLFFLYGFNHYFLLNATRMYKAPVLPDRTRSLPNVSIHLPVYNERYVIRRLIKACAAMAETYGVDKVNIKILDDSTDDTSREIDQIVREYSGQQIHIEILRRDNRDGFKAGALQQALLQTSEEFIVIFDADFIPPADFLISTIPYFELDDRLGIVQSRWTHLNREYNLLTKAIAIGIDVHFLIEQTGRYAAGLFQNFNGSGGVLRKKAMIEAGGWQSDTLSEDLDLSYRMQMLGYRLLFLKDLHSPGEVPPTVPSFKKQQGRWACGSLRTARKILPNLLHNRDLGWKQRLQAFIHLTGYMLHPLMLFSFLLICVVILSGATNGAYLYNNYHLPFSGFFSAVHGSISTTIQYFAWDLLLSMIAVCTFAPWISLIVALKTQNLSVTRNLVSLLTVFLLGYGVSLSNSIEAGKALFSNRNWGFSRTPKYATLDQHEDWKRKKYQIPLDFSWVLEMMLIFLGGISIASAIIYSNFGALFILIPYTFAYAFVFSLTIIQSRRERAS